MSFSSPKLRAEGLAGRVGRDCSGSGEFSATASRMLSALFPPYPFLQKASSQRYTRETPTNNISSFLPPYISPECEDRYMYMHN